MGSSVIMAVDFDGILVHDTFPTVGSPSYEMVRFIREVQNAGVETILWTSRVDDKLRDAKEWCEHHGLHFSGVNNSAPSNLNEYRTDPRKVYADIYLDDKSPHFQWTVYRMGYDVAVDAMISETRELLELKGVKL